MVLHGSLMVLDCSGVIHDAQVPNGSAVILDCSEVFIGGPRWLWGGSRRFLDCAWVV